MSLENRHRLIIVRLYKALEDGDIPGYLAFYDPAIEQIEWPNPLKPTGERRGLAQMAVDMARGQSLLQSQTYDLTSIVCGEAQVAVEAVWAGILAMPFGKLQPGQSLRAHICNLFTLRDNKIISQRNYDCFERFN